MKINVGQLLTHRANNSPHVEAAVDLGSRITYLQLNQQVNQLVHWLEKKQVKPKERIAILCQNGISMMTILYATAKLGAIALPLNVNLGMEEYRLILQESLPAILFYDESSEDIVKNLGRIRSIKTKVQLGGINTSDTYRFPDILEGESTEEKSITTGGDDQFLLIYTSGTTGKSKGVMISHHNLWMSGYVLGNHFDWRSTDRNLIITPMFHISGCMFMVTNAVRGSTVVISKFHPKLIWTIIEKERITQFMAVPAMLKLMLEEADWIEKDIDSLRYIICGADIVSPQLIRKFKLYGIDICHGYGCTEYSGTTTCWTNQMSDEKRHTVGKPFPFTELKIVDPLTGEELPNGMVGEVVYRGPQLFLGYWKNREETNKVLRNGWYYSGDLGKLDQDGYLFIVDRFKDMIVCNGENLYPGEIEGILLNLDGVLELAVVAAPDKNKGHVPMAFLVKLSHSKLTKQEVLHYCQERIPYFTDVEQIQFLEALPRNATGKIMKSDLRSIATIIVDKNITRK
ncbi:class I adenylate-forming enzyme family protein [Shimazuella kribbensis]|uniref:class I adenylate-forming enzyme family protein n=1 Tax=Shimazuella kribbensis TaxID=139808 RepID=UPI000429545D|nr:class I adenylate-forming enzyme family protein [Shimazuella kribbensis]